MANDGTVKIGTELDETGFKEGLQGLNKTASSVLKTGAAAIAGISAAATGAVAGLSALAESTEEYRVAQGKLNTAFEAAGFSAETAQKSYNAFYEILGDTDTATEASQLLAKLAENEEDVSKWTDIAAGVFGTFGDSLPIEGLIEASNETAKVGEVTGVLADALNWAGISEDEFNEKLAACTSESERNQLIMETLAGTYDDATNAFYKNNAALIESRKAQARLDEIMGKLGEQASIVKTEIMTGLTPALENLVENVDWEKLGSAISDFVSAIIDNGPTIISIVAGIGGGFVAWKVATIVSGAVTAIKTLVTALTSATSAQAGLNAVMSANPIVLLITAVAGVTSALFALAGATSLARDETESLTGKIAEARSEYESLSAEIAENQENTAGQIVALQSLVEQENKTAAQKQAIKDLVDDLNESVPELSLAYDDQTDSLNMTTEAIKAAAQAEYDRAKQEAAIERISEAYTEQIQIAEELEAAQKTLEEAQTRYSEATENSTAKTSRQKDKMYAYKGAVIAAQGEVDRLTELQKQNNEEIQNLEVEYGYYTNTTLEEARQASIQLINQYSQETIAVNATTAAIKTKIKAMLAAAQAAGAAAKESMAISGLDPFSLALSTAEYAKSQVEVKRYTDALGALEKAEAEAAGEAQKLNNSLVTGSGGGSSTSKTSGTSRALTTAEKNLQLYQDAVKQLDHEREMDLISEEEYYKRKAELGAKYLEEGSDEQMALEEELYKWEKEQRDQDLENRSKSYQEEADLLKKRLENGEITTEEYFSELNRIQSEYLEEGTDDWVEAMEYRNEEMERLQEDFVDAFTDGLDQIGEEYVSAMEDIQSAQDSLASKLSDTGDLFVSADGYMKLTNLQDGIDQINEYGDSLEKLTDRGISESLMAEILSMDVEDATQYMGKLLEMTDEDFAEYNALWEEKQRRAKEIAENFYADQMDVLETEFTDDLAGALSEVPETMETIGRDAIKAWIEGFQAEQGTAIDAAEAFQAAIDKAMGVVSTTNSSMTPAAATTPQFTTENAVSQAAGVVAMASTSNGNREIVLNLNGTEVARAVVDNIRSVESQSPAIVSDRR